MTRNYAEYYEQLCLYPETCVIEVCACAMPLEFPLVARARYYFLDLIGCLE